MRLIDKLFWFARGGYRVQPVLILSLIIKLNIINVSEISERVNIQNLKLFICR